MHSCFFYYLLGTKQDCGSWRPTQVCRVLSFSKTTSDPRLHKQRKKVRITLHSQVYFSLGMPRHVSTSSQKRNVCQRQRFLHERMLRGTCQLMQSSSFILIPFSSKIPEIVDAWKSDLQGKGRSKLASSIASPTEHENLFEEGWSEAVKREGDLDSVA